MNIGCGLKGWVCLWMLITGSAVHAQVVFNPKIGLETWSLKDEKESSGHSKHPGQMIGLDLFMEKEPWFFMPGFEYHRVSMQNESHAFGLDFNTSQHAHYLIIPLQAGYKLLRDTSFHVSGVAGLDVSFFYDMDENELGLEDDQFYGITTNLTLGLFAGLFTFLTVDVKYHYALQPTLKTRDDSKWRGWTFALGCKF